MSGLTESCHEQCDEYFELIQFYPLRTIRDDGELEEASSMADSLVERCDLTHGGQEYLEALTTLIEAYENSIDPIADASDADVLGHLMEARGVKQTEVAIAANIVASTISDVMHGRRKFNREQIGRLAKYFHVSPAVFSFDKE
jgi:HTH-type transcriptional regulator / antitoxin HigA